MSQVHGRAITSEEIERLTGRDFGPARFASMCNAISWASAKKRPTSLPSFTERVNVSDGGVDAEWDIELPEKDYSSPLLGPGWNVFQYKQRDVAAVDRDKLFSKIKSSLKGAVQDLYEKKKRRPDRYVLFVNLDLNHDQKHDLKEKICKDYDRPEEVTVEIAGAAEIATFLTDIPHLRFAYLQRPEFSTVEAEWEAHRSAKSFGAGVELVGRETEMEDLTSFFADPGSRAMVLAGPQGMGKTRLALEAAKSSRPFETIVAVEAQSLGLGDLLTLKTSDSEVVVIVDDPDPDKAEELVHGALAAEGLKVLIVLPTTEDAPAPNFGQDERVLTLKLAQLSIEQARELLWATGAALDFALEHWVIERAGGNPDLLLTAASVGPDLRVRAVSFAQEVGKAFEQKVKRRFGEATVKKLELLSLLPQVGVYGEAALELDAIVEHFGDGVSKHDVLRVLEELAAAGLLRMRGSYAEVTPAFFANYLCAVTLRGRASELVTLFSTLNFRARRRMIRRLQGLTAEEASSFWDALIGTGGPLEDLTSAWAYPKLLRPVASAKPKLFVDMVKNGLLVMSPEERREITGEERQQLVWALQECLYRRETSQAALHCLSLLAEAETDDHGSNATSIFCESFYWTNKQLPLTLSRRLLVLREIFEKGDYARLRPLAVKAIKSSIPRRGMMLFVSQGPEPLDTAPRVTSEELTDYIDSLAALLMEVAYSEDPETAEGARSALPGSIATSAFYGRPEVAVERLKTMVEWALAREVPVPISDLAFQLRRVRDGLRGGEAELKEGGAVGEVERLIEQLDSGNFVVRLKKLAGHWTFEDYKYETDEDAQNLERGVRKLRGLAEEIIDSPAELTDELLEWLCSPEAEKGHILFWQLGKLDEERGWLSKVEELGARDEGAASFGGYFAGLADHSRELVEDRLDELVESEVITEQAILVALSRLGGSPRGIDRIENLLGKRRLEPALIGRAISGRWTENLEPDECLRLLRLLAGSRLEDAIVAIRVANFWELMDKPLEGDLADFVWQCLRAARSASQHDDYELDRLAAALAQHNPEQGFQLLESLLGDLDEAGWEPISDRPENQLWHALENADRERAIRLAVSLAATDELRIIGIPQMLQGLLDQQTDHDLLLSLAIEDEKQAKIIANSITASEAAFWPLAVQILAEYPGNEDIQSGVELGARRIRGGVIFFGGSLADQTESILEEVRHVLEDPDIPEAARTWLEAFATHLREKVERERVEEADEAIDR